MILPFITSQQQTAAMYVFSRLALLAGMHESRKRSHARHGLKVTELKVTTAELQQRESARPSIHANHAPLNHRPRSAPRPVSRCSDDSMVTVRCALDGKCRPQSSDTDCGSRFGFHCCCCGSVCLWFVSQRPVYLCKKQIASDVWPRW